MRQHDSHFLWSASACTESSAGAAAPGAGAAAVIASATTSSSLASASRFCSMPRTRAAKSILSTRVYLTSPQRAIASSIWPRLAPGVPITHSSASCASRKARRACSGVRLDVSVVPSTSIVFFSRQPASCSCAAHCANSPAPPAAAASWKRACHACTFSEYSCSTACAGRLALSSLRNSSRLPLPIDGSVSATNLARHLATGTTSGAAVPLDSLRP